MKTMKFVFTFVVMTTGVTAVPTLSNLQDESNERAIVERTIERLIREFCKELKNKGLDPLTTEAISYKYKLPDADIFSVEAFLGELLLEGLSNIRINHVSYSVFTSRLQLDLSMPLVFGSIGPSKAHVKLFDTSFGGKFKGSVAVKEIRLYTDVRLHIGIISGVAIRSINVDFSVHDIESALKVVIFGFDLSHHVNHILGEIPKIIRENREEINKILEQIIKEVFDRLL